MNILDVKILKKNGTKESYSDEKIITAVSKSAERACKKLSDKEYNDLCALIKDFICSIDSDDKIITVEKMHNIVENALDKIDADVAKSYRDYRNYKQDFVHIMDEVLQMHQGIMYLADKDNANTDSSITSTKRSLLYKKLSRELYQTTFLRPSEVEAIKDGYIYIHDLGDRLHCSHNCCVVDLGKILDKGFEMSNVKYKKPNRLSSLFGVLCDITLNVSAQQYGGFTISQIDKTISPYAEETYQAYLKEFDEIAENIKASISEEDYKIKRDEFAYNKVKKDLENGFQAMEYKFNTVASSRGDFSFITISFGLATDRWGKLAAKTAMKVRMKGQGEPAVPMLFPKLVFLADLENLHGEGKPNSDVFDVAVECSNNCMYPDYVSLNGEYTGDIYKKYGKAISPMGKGLNLTAHLKLRELFLRGVEYKFC